MSLGSDLWVQISLTERLFADLTDVTLADEDINSIPSDDVNRAMHECLPNLQLMHVVLSGGQNWN